MYAIKLPRGIKIDIDNIPDDFDEIISNAFQEYTEGTRKEYTYQDKLAFIDRCRELLHHSGNEEDCIMELMKDRFEYEVNECGEFPDESEFLSIEFMAQCYQAGKTNLYAHYTGDHHVDDKIMELLARVIKLVMDYE